MVLARGRKKKIVMKRWSGRKEKELESDEREGMGKKESHKKGKGLFQRKGKKKRV